MPVLESEATLKAGIPRKMTLPLLLRLSGEQTENEGFEQKI